MKGIIYIHRNKINGKCYVGQTTRRKAEDRWGSDGIFYKGCTKFWNAIQKYGFKDGFDHIILPKIYTSIEELNEAEKNKIAELDSFNNGYNSTLGGDGVPAHNVSVEARKKISETHKGRKLSEEHKCKISEANKGHKTSEETRKKISEAQKGRKYPGKFSKGGTWEKGHEPWNKGKKLSEEIVAKMRGKTISEEQKQKISASLKGRTISEETKRKISEARKGEKRSEEWKRKISDSVKKSWAERRLS